MERSELRERPRGRAPYCASLHTSYELHPERHRPHIAALEIAVARQRPQREEFRIAVVAQIEHAGETGRGVARLVPKTVGALLCGEIGDAAGDCRMIDAAGGPQAEQRPRRL